MELRDRLRLALRPGTPGSLAREVGPPPSRSRDLVRSLEAIPALRPIQTARGTVHVAEQSWPLTYSHGRLRLEEALALAGPALSRLAPTMSARELRSAAFFDVETTGLAGGTGTYVFLIGIGTFGEDSFTVRQFFLADLPAETAMLAAVADLLAGCPALVSFNGRRFDVPMLATRLTLNRLASLPEVKHMDLLYPARRLYRRRLPSCRLGTLEEHLLGLAREDDTPGWLIPSLYIDYVRTGNADPLRAVFQHNALDILSLVTLLAHMGRLADGATPAEAEDYVALGRWDESEGRLADAASMYATALEATDDGEARAIARVRLAYLCRRLNRLDDAARLWREEVDSGGPVEARLGALVELAKLEEHRWRDYAAAETSTRRALSLLEVAALGGADGLTPQLRREALEHRLWRVRRRLASAQARRKLHASASARTNLTARATPAGECPGAP